MSKQSIVRDNTGLSGITVTLPELMDLRKKALYPAQLNVKKRLSLPGQKLTNIRSRGIEFDATREYQAGDDIRSMAWRVTARSLKAHIKVYREEKERPVWLALDLSPSLYFGTRCMFKSVQSIRQAALTGWSSLLKRERIGTVISAEPKPRVFQPRAGEKHYLAILRSFAELSCLPSAFNEHHYLHHLLLSLQQHTRSGNLIYIYSDFLQFNTETEKLLLVLSQRAQLILNFVYDPFEASPPPPYRYQLTNGIKTMLFNMQDAQNRETYRQLFQNRFQQIQDFARKHKITLNLYCTGSAREEER